MLEPLAQDGVAGVGILVIAAALQAWGVDGVAIGWGCAGGLFLLSRNEKSMGVGKASLSVMASAGAAGALSPAVAHGVMLMLPALPRHHAVEAIAFIIGFGAQRLVPVILDTILETIPKAVVQWLGQFFGRGPKDGQ